MFKKGTYQFNKEPNFKLEDVTIIGASLGGYLAPRAAAFEKRITKVIGWSIFPDLWNGLNSREALIFFS